MGSRQPDDLTYIDKIIAKLKEFIEPRVSVLPKDTQIDSSDKEMQTHYLQGARREMPAYRKTDASGKKRLYICDEDGTYYASLDSHPATLSHCLNFKSGIKLLEFIKNSPQRDDPQRIAKPVRSALSMIGKESVGIYNAYQQVVSPDQTAPYDTLEHCLQILVNANEPISRDEARELLRKHREVLTKLDQRIQDWPQEDKGAVARSDTQVISIILAALQAIATGDSLDVDDFARDAGRGNIRNIPSDPSKAVEMVVVLLLKTWVWNGDNRPYWDQLMKMYVTGASLSPEGKALTAFFDDITCPRRLLDLEEKAVRDRPVVSVATHHSTTFTSASSSSSVQQSTSSSTSANTAAPRQPH